MDIFKTGGFYYTLAMIKQYLWIILLSMVPLIELRGAIPVSQAMQLPVIPSFIVCIIANMIPVPFIYLFARKVLEWGQDKKYIGKIWSRTFYCTVSFCRYSIAGNRCLDRNSCSKSS